LIASGVVEPIDLAWYERKYGKPAPCPTWRVMHLAMEHDQLVRYLKEKRECAFQNKYGYGLRTRVEAQFSRIKRCLGDTLLTRRIASQVQEGRIIANLINQWNAFGLARCVKKA
jgi:hypothetical protein